jgi:hypothetical protein
MRRLILLLVLPATLAIAACSSSGSAASGGADPAAAVPRGVPAYLEVSLRPQGDARDGALAAAGKVLHTGDPAGRIRELLQQAGRMDGVNVDFAKEIEPWLGDRAGAWFAPPAAGQAAGKPGGGMVVAVRDSAAAGKSLRAILAREGEKLTARSAGGRDYEVGSDGTALAFTDAYAIVGTEGEVKRALATLDGDGLASEDRYTQAIDKLPPDRVASWFVDPKPLIEAAMAADPKAGAGLGPLTGLLTSQMAPQTGALWADGDRIVAESLSPSSGLAGVLGALAGAAASPLLKELPGDAWGALAVPKVGESLRAAFGQFAGVLGTGAITGELRSRLGLDLERDVFSWMGDAGLFVRGMTTGAVDGALVVEATDEPGAAAGFGKAVGLLRTRGGLDPRPVRIAGADGAFAVRKPGVPQPVVIARGGGRVVVAYGSRAAEAALAGGSGSAGRLGDSVAYGDARKALDGYDPSAFAAVAPILALVQDAGAGNDPRYVEAKPYLEAFSTLAFGSKTDGGTIRSRAAAGLR